MRKAALLLGLGRAIKRGGRARSPPGRGPPHRHKRQTDTVFLLEPMRLETETIRLEAGNLMFKIRTPRTRRSPRSSARC